MTNHYEQLISVLRDVFQLDRSDLDFGIYRILNQKSEQIEEFLTKRLLVEVKEILKQSWSSEFQKLEQETEEKRKTLIELWVDPETNEKYKELQAQLSKLFSMDSLEQEVYSHLTNFFKRYYKEGDFISLRRYKNNTYAIPYEWEEVKLYRANHDQYYIKTTENLKNYAFYVWPNKEQKVIFRLVEANTEQNNNKTQGNKERRFALYEEHPFDEEVEILIINCTYDLYEKSTTQKLLTEKALAIITKKISKKFQPDLLILSKDNKRTVIEKHFNDFTTKHTFDYFIHKDLEWFLSRELDFYIKNEILHIDDIDTTNDTHFLSQLSKIKALKQVGSKIITMLAQVENFQKKLREKKKFITNTHYCLTLDKVPESYYNDILQNKQQLEERKKLFNVAIKTLEELKNDPFLVLDTKFFSSEWKDALLAEFENIDEECDGLLINSENRQALNLLQERYREKIKCTYIDPPYNTGKDWFIYKDSFRDSSRISFMSDRVKQNKSLITDNWCVFCSIWIDEVSNLSNLFKNLFWNENIVWIASREMKKWANRWTHYSPATDYVLTFAKNLNSLEKFNKPITQAYIDSFNLDDNDWRWAYKLKSLYEPTLDYYANCRYKIKCPDNEYVITPEWKSFSHNKESFEEMLADNRIVFIEWRSSKLLNIDWSITKWSVKRKIYLKEMLVKWRRPSDLILSHINWEWTKEMTTLWLKFSFAKPSWLIKFLVWIMNSNDSIVLDYFSWSWTTWHAVIKLNREDGLKRKYILVEMWEYFDTVNKTRIQKVIYSDNWKNGKPKDKNWISQMFKYLELESYEDTLNNLVLQKTDKQQALLAVDSNLNDQYMLHYMLDTESREHLLSVKHFTNPFDYKLAITKQNETKTISIDLIETFNYLIGIHIEKQRIQDGYKCIKWHTLDEKNVLVIRRNQEEKNNKNLNSLFKKVREKLDTSSIDTIYVNGDTMLENIRQKSERRSVKLTEELFLDKMFSSLS